MTRAHGPRDLALCAVAAVAAVCLVVVAFVRPPAAEGIVVGLGTIGAGALGRLSGASSTDPAGAGRHREPPAPGA